MRWTLQATAHGMCIRLDGNPTHIAGITFSPCVRSIQPASCLLPVEPGLHGRQARMPNEGLLFDGFACNRSGERGFSPLEQLSSGYPGGICPHMPAHVFWNALVASQRHRTRKTWEAGMSEGSSLRIIDSMVLQWPQKMTQDTSLLCNIHILK